MKSQLQEIRERAEKATPGPWLLSMSNQVVRVLEPEPKAIAKFVEDDIPNAEFIAHARSDIPKLLAALEVAYNFINRYAGPEGCGCEIGSMKHFAQQTREQINALLEGKHG